METIISILAGLVAILGFFGFRKYKQNIQLKADKDLTVQAESSKIVDEVVSSAQEKVDKLEKEIESPVEDDFWDKYKDK